MKFLKEMLSNKRQWKKFETITLTAGCCALLNNKIPQKLKDPRSFPIPYSIGWIDAGNDLCDLDNSINLMDFSIFKKLGHT